jgi:hypothetical protein
MWVRNKRRGIAAATIGSSKNTIRNIPNIRKIIKLIISVDLEEDVTENRLFVNHSNAY